MKFAATLNNQFLVILSRAVEALQSKPFDLDPLKIKDQSP